MPNRIIRLLTLTLFLLPVFPAASQATEYSIGIVPQFEQRKLYSIWKPIVDELEKRTNLKFKLITNLHVGDFEKEFLQGTFDLVYMNPYFIAKTSKTLGYVPLIRDKSPLRGILVALKNGPVRRIEDLQGKTIAFSTPNSLAGCMMVKADLKENYGIDIVPVYVNTASNSYFHVLKGFTDAAGVPDKSFAIQDAATRDLLQVLYQSKEIPPHPIAANPRVAKTDQDKIQKAFLDLSSTPKGQEMLAKIPIKAAIAANIGEYLALNKLNLDAHWDPNWKEDEAK